MYQVAEIYSISSQQNRSASLAEKTVLLRGTRMLHPEREVLGRASEIIQFNYLRKPREAKRLAQSHPAYLHQKQM